MIICPTCQLSTQIPLFRCVRCADHLFDGADAEGMQIVLRFVGGVRFTLVVQRNNQPVHVEGILVDGARVRLTLAGGVQSEQQASSLFNVLLQRAQLWNLD